MSTVPGKVKGTQRRRPPMFDIDGVVLLDKPEGLSSNGALQRVRRCFNAAKAGHTGTLDPMATGLLPVCFGDATKFSQGLLDADKSYLATALLGSATDTGDREGKVVSEQPVPPLSIAQVAQVLAGLVGPLSQLPPMYSALKHQGQPLYAIARAGGEVERSERSVVIHALDLVEWSAPRLTFAVRCSKGTYVRTLAGQVAERLGTVAHLVSLRRTAVGPFTLDRAVTLDTLESADPEGREAGLLPADTLVQALPQVVLPADVALGLLQGRTVELPASCADGLVAGAGLARVYGPDSLPGMRMQPGVAPSGQVFLGVAAPEIGVSGRVCLRPVRLVALRTGPTGSLPEEGIAPVHGETA